jgi:hypothetical protein
MLGRGGFIDDADAAFVSGVNFALRCDVERLRQLVMNVVVSCKGEIADETLILWCCLCLISLIALKARVMQTLPTWLLLVVVNAQASLTVNFSISRSKQEGALNAR